MSKFSSDLLDEYCDDEFGHTDWERKTNKKGNIIVTFFAEPREGYVEDDEENDDE